MSLKVFAEKIPDEVRSEMLKSDLIGLAVVSVSDEKMLLLQDIWHDYIEPHKEKTSCYYCLQNIYQNYKAMLPDLTELENQYQKFKNL